MQQSTGDGSYSDTTSSAATGFTDRISFSMSALNMAETQEGEADDARGGLGADERARLMVAAMSPEHIILCVDVGPEMRSMWAGAGPRGAAMPRMRVVQAALLGFVRRKASFNPKHKFALCVFGDDVKTVRTLTDDVRSIMEAIERLQPSGWPDTPVEDQAPFDFSYLLAYIAEQFPPRSTSSSRAVTASVGVAGGMGAVSHVRPVVRAVLVYGRSYTCPLVPVPEETNIPLLAHERFFLDCIYIHHKPSEEGVVCQEAFDRIASMESYDRGSLSYLLECGHNLQRFNIRMASLLAHPVQRDYRYVFFDKLESGSANSGEAGAAPGAYSRSPTRGAQSAFVASNSMAPGNS